MISKMINKMTKISILIVLRFKMEQLLKDSHRNWRFELGHGHHETRTTDTMEKSLYDFGRMIVIAIKIMLEF